VKKEEGQYGDSVGYCEGIVVNVAVEGKGCKSHSICCFAMICYFSLFVGLGELKLSTVCSSKLED
jgi:hypothetical protein